MALSETANYWARLNCTLTIYWDQGENQPNQDSNFWFKKKRPRGLLILTSKKCILSTMYLPCIVLSVYDYLSSLNLNKRVFFFKRVFFRPKIFRARS